MTYYAGIRFGPINSDPRIVCNECGRVRYVEPRRGTMPPKWFLDGKAPPGWKTWRVENSRFDACGDCKATYIPPETNDD